MKILSIFSNLKYEETATNIDNPVSKWLHLLLEIN